MTTRALFALLALASFIVLEAHGFDVESLRPSVVRIIAPDGTGSGFVIASSSDGCRVVTNHHVIEAAGDGGGVYVARLNGDKIECYEGVVLWSDAYHDLAVVLVQGMQASPLPLSTLEPPVAEDAYALGFPGVADDGAGDPEDGGARAYDSFVEFVTSRGNVATDPTGQATRYVTASVSIGGVRRIVSSKWDMTDPIEEFKIVESDVNITAGNSGGPLLNNCGEVIGVNTQRVRDASIPVDIVRRSSHSSALISLLRRQGIPFTSTSEPCTAAIASVPAQHKNLLGLVAMLSAAALGTAIFVAVRKPQVVRESYTQFMRHAGATTQTLRQALAGSRSDRKSGHGQARTEARHQAPAAAASDSVATLSLRGHDPEDRARGEIFWQLPSQASGKHIIGRKSGLVHLCLANSSVSGQHAALWREGRTIYIEDRNSSNGTLVNGQKLRSFTAQSLRHGDRIQLGDVILQVAIG